VKWVRGPAEGYIVRRVYRIYIEMRVCANRVERADMGRTGEEGVCNLTEYDSAIIHGYG
jgi:hypothetical protein